MKYSGKIYTFSMRVKATVRNPCPTTFREVDLDDYVLLVADFAPSSFQDLEHGVAKKVTKTFLRETQRNGSMNPGDIFIILAGGTLDSYCGKLDIDYENFEVRVRRRKDGGCGCQSQDGWNVVFDESLCP